MRRYHHSGRNSAQSHVPVNFPQLAAAMPSGTRRGLPPDRAGGNCQRNQPGALAFG